MATQHWSREVVTREIARLSEEGQDLRHSEVSAHHQRLVSAAVRYYGSWGAAVSAAGIDYPSIRRQSQDLRSAKVTRWSLDSIAAEIRQLIRDGESLAAATVRKAHPALFSAAVSRRYFGSWRNALTAVGLNYDEVLERNKAASTAPGEARGMRTVMRRLHVLGHDAERLSGSEALSRYPRLYEKAAAHFGSWENALNAVFGPEAQAHRAARRVPHAG